MRAEGHQAKDLARVSNGKGSRKICPGNDEVNNIRLTKPFCGDESIAD